ncbi:hypothetical protein L6164_010449 [Bauhinia variegata]|uniref:Uncharacterized protein n=1 Tax=Bauhinia variegata TaxID=167791 RepID=A0ACB9PQ47_BAUVA|nr:hypothetical protein L6164_010449 [Bauhinia variegata]
MFCCNSGSAQDELQEQSITKALSCFDNKLIYVGCNEAYRLNPSGNINIPAEATDFFCSGPCQTETELVLDCIDRILSNFVFYNKATLSQMRYVLRAGCSYTRQRGNCNLGEYLEGEASNACKLPILSSFYLFMIVAAAVNSM